jgi:hypothetical protein
MGLDWTERNGTDGWDERDRQNNISMIHITHCMRNASVCDIEQACKVRQGTGFRGFPRGTAETSECLTGLE